MLLSKIKNSKGYISIEVTIVMGLLISLGVIQILAFSNTSNKVKDRSYTYVSQTLDKPIFSYVN